MTGFRIGTRGSALALWQAGEVARLLRQHGLESEIVIIRTTGDRVQNVPLASIGGKGVFIKELEEALDRGSIDCAVHSLKDVPSIVPERYRLAAFLERADPRDVWIHAEGKPIEAMPSGTVVGTSAPRRRAQLRALHPHLELRDIRGNVDSRIDKVRRGEYQGAVLASAGITRLGRAEEITSYFPVDVMVPAAGQGIVAVETLVNRGTDILERINDDGAALAAKTERGVLQRFGTLLDCHSAVAVHAETSGDAMTIRAFFSDAQGRTAIQATASGRRAEADGLVDAIARDLTSKGAIALLDPGVTA